ncbi:MAG: cell division protein FtsB [Gammaproteobacteria bacterium]|nr:cell division protein FtsB [Gammaproteobacteria bacterium]
MRWLATALLVALILLQYRIWISDDGLRGVDRLQHAVVAQQKLDATLGERNSRLEAEVQDLKSGTAAIEERARSDLGMIGPDETFYQVVEPPPAVTISPASASRVAKEARGGR